MQTSSISLVFATVEFERDTAEHERQQHHDYRQIEAGITIA